MNIENMSDYEKSVILAKLAGWRLERKLSKAHKVVDQIDVYFWFLRDATGRTIGVHEDDEDGEEWSDMMFKYNLYNEDNMALAWRVLNFFLVNLSESVLFDFSGWVLYIGLLEMPPTDAQRLWLDKTLSLAIEAGMVEEANE